MARWQAKARATAEQTLRPVPFCWACGQPTRVAYHGQRRITHLWGMCRYILVVRRCHNRACGRYRVSLRPEEEGALALPHGEFGLDVLALIGQLRFAQRRSMRQIHQTVREREVRLAPRTVTELVHRYEALLALPEAVPTGLAERLRRQERVVLAVDGVQPDQGHAVLWVLRDVLSGTVLRARAGELVPLVRAVAAAVPVPIVAVISDGQRAIGEAVRTALPGVPPPLGQLRYLRTATTPLVEADGQAGVDSVNAMTSLVRKADRAVDAGPERVSV